MRAGVRRLAQQNAFANCKRRGMIAALMQPACALELRRRDSLAFGGSPRAAFPQHLFEDRKQHRDRIVEAGPSARRY
ncbi:MAG TPA: hypothetical protein VD839_17035 [Burkholderiales bacterium]|nr:hypothetical protein [Burkholderiales bacterium]